MPFSAISLLHSLDLEAGDWIVQNTANGAVGRMVAQIAKARGIHVIGLVRRRSSVAELAEQGIDNVGSTDTGGWRDAALALADGARIVAGVDSVGGSASNDVLSLLSENGTLVIFGSMGESTLGLKITRV
ncbi:zinc-binding dehydrogenase, partial [Clavibacter michiganensis]|uniref:zinc-binding dehydrogenase n=1 Tax=Clavibacter michiganensis TaxID=28447 RepID=UPI00292DBD7A